MLEAQQRLVMIPQSQIADALEAQAEVNQQRMI